jgi:ApaG protein
MRKVLIDGDSRIDRMTGPEFSCSVKVAYLDEQSQPAAGVFAFAYTVTIVNSGDVTAQLIARHWVITDALGHSEEVRGLAVVGHQPLLKPGERFEYTSWTRLATPQGTMRGTYMCMTEDARPFEAAVPEFMLARPEQLH